MTSMSALPSYVHGTGDKPLIGQTIGQFFDDACRRFAERDALIVRHQGIRWRYAELQEQVERLACGLRRHLRLGLRMGHGQRLPVGGEGQRERRVVLRQMEVPLPDPDPGEAEHARHDERRPPGVERDQHAGHNAVERQARTPPQAIHAHRMTLLPGRADDPADADRVVEGTEGANAAQGQRQRQQRCQ